MKILITSLSTKPIDGQYELFSWHRKCVDTDSKEHHLETLNKNSWTADGVVALKDYLDRSAILELQTEAAELEKFAIEHSIERVEERRDGSFATPSRFRVHRGGTRLTALHRNMDLLQLVREATGLDRLVPVRCSYNFYAPEHFMGVHRDEIRATVTATFSLTNGLPPTQFIPESRTWDSAELVRFVAEEGHLPAEGTDMGLPVGTVNLFDGYNLAHWRPPVEQNAILANLVYFRL